MKRSQPRCEIALLCVVSVVLASCSSAPAEPEWRRFERAAEASYRAGDLVAAKRDYARLLKAKPMHSHARLRLGAIAYQRGDSVEAKRQFELALNSDARNARATYNLAMLSLNEASAHLEAYVALAPAGPGRARAAKLLNALQQFEPSP